ncbi:HIT family protein [Microlunatus soli]|uniref:Histidine triad (HIT) family protein n=1 Tax=Microlunatus soli TaxID=630515 RepID=A0A1H1QHU9_9ACTN|nr:HIT domain-containing protein [Microlunatus soli]SDS22964.1 histidine triad (HIT) family protein [Microlunatus soli]
MNEIGCTFCRIGSEDPWDQVFYSDDHSVAFLDLAPATLGHSLVIPRRHSADIFSVGEAEFAAVGRAVHRVARRLEDRLHPDGLSIFQSNRAAGWQDVFHLHVHLLPRYVGDGLTPPWTETSEQVNEISGLAASLR